MTCNSSIPSLSIITVANNSCEAGIENRAASMANNDCNKALSSPVEASPAKLASTSPTTLETTVNDTGLVISHIASAADSLPYEESSNINMTDLPASTPFGNAGERDFPGVLSFKGVTVTLESSAVWNNFNNVGTEMILTRQGRHMFPYCRYRVSGLEPDRKYSMVLSVAPADAYKYRWNSKKWEVLGPAEHLSQGLIRAYAHHYSPCTGKEWMNYMVSFKKLKLTNNPQDQEGNIILHSMHRYIPRLHVIPVLDGVAPTADQPVVMGPESMTFTFPQTEFMAVTTYQNFRITQMKIHYNPFAKGFKNEGYNPRLPRKNTEIEFVNMTGTSEATGRAEDESTNDPPEDAQEKQIILKPIMSSYSSNVYVQCRGKHALGNIVVVQKRAAEEPPKEKNCNINLIPPMKLCITVNPKSKLGSSLSTKRLLHKRKKRFSRQWGCAQRKEWKSASPTEAHSPPLTVAMQPELDDVEGLLFVSFTSKSALTSHIGDKPVRKPASQSKAPQTPDLIKLTENMLLEAKLLQDLRVFKHRQTIHPVLQEVGLKLSTLDPTQPIDLQYLGVQLPLPPPKLPEGSAGGGQPFISRTGKTSDITKIKGWRNKFIKSNDTLSNSEGSKNLSAFCSNMLDEYLESEAQQISERAAAFSTHPQGSVAYQLPAKSSSYVKTLDSALKQRNPPTIVPNKPLLNSGRESPASPPTSSSPALSEDSFSDQLSTPYTPSSAPGLHQTISTAQSRCESPPEANYRQTASNEWRPFSLSRPQLKLFELELGAWNKGLERTELAQDRLSVALSAVMTKWTHLNEVFKAPHYQRTQRLPCGRDFCRLGCVCQSLKGQIKRPSHCRRPECMLSCTCPKLSTGETDEDSTYSVKPVGDVGTQSHSQPKKLWIRNICDSDREPLLIPKSTNVPHPKPSRPVIPQIREEDKSPVYKYLESKLTCARVREFNNRPPPVESLEDLTKQSLNVTKLANQTTTAIPEKPNPPTTTIPHRPIPTTKTVPKRPVQATKTIPEKPKEKAYKSVFFEGTTATGKKPRTLIEIQSVCQWADDRKQILEALCTNMNRNKLCESFSVGKYRVRPVAKIIMQKPTGTVTTYRVRISLRHATGSDCDSGDNEEEERQPKNSDEKTVGGNSQDMKEPQFSVGVTPFLCGVQTAGVLVARTASSSGQSSGLVQVNGKSYDHARLAVGRLGALHPANRLAAYLTGRLGGSHNRLKKIAELSRLASNMNPPRPVLNKTATIDQRIVTQPLVKSLLPNFQKPSTFRTIPQPPKPASATLNSTTLNPGQRIAPGPFQRSSPVSLTVSPSLKTPSFLGQKGTYSFRIRPPDNEDPSLPGVQLPGGFTLIHLPTPTTNTAANQHINNSNFNRDFLRAGALSLFNENKGNTTRQVESDMDSDSSSEYSDDYDEDDHELSVDIETVEEREQESMISRLRRAAGMDPESRKPGHQTAPRRYVTQYDGTEIRDRRGEKKYSERQRRSEQRIRFDHLQSVLQPSIGNQTPRLQLLSMATDEIQDLLERSINLKEKKRLLTQIRDGYAKEIALLSGNSEEAILESVGAVPEKQKPEAQMNWNSAHSDVLKAEAALLKAMKSQPPPEPSPLLKPLLDDADLPETSQEPEDPDKPISQGNAAEQIKATAKNFVQQLLSKLKPIINNARSYHQAAKKLESQNPSQSLGQLSKQIDERCEYEARKASAPRTDNTKRKEPPKESTPASQPQTPLAYPLVRAKNGRIILPSSMKPLGQGFYTFTVVPSQEEGNSSSTVVLQPLDPEALKKQGINVLKKQDVNVSESEDPKKL